MFTFVSKNLIWAKADDPQPLSSDWAIFTKTLNVSMKNLYISEHISLSREIRRRNWNHDATFSLTIFLKKLRSYSLLVQHFLICHHDDADTTPGLESTSTLIYFASLRLLLNRYSVDPVSLFVSGQWSRINPNICSIASR